MLSVISAREISKPNFLIASQVSASSPSLSPNSISRIVANGSDKLSMITFGTTFFASSVAEARVTTTLALRVVFDVDVVLFVIIVFAD